MKIVLAFIFFLLTSEIALSQQQSEDTVKYSVHLGYFPTGTVSAKALYFYMDESKSGGLKPRSIHYPNKAATFLTEPVFDKKECQLLIDRARDSGLYNLFLMRAYQDKVLLESEWNDRDSISYFTPEKGEYLISKGVLLKQKYNAYQISRDIEELKEVSLHHKYYADQSSGDRFELTVSQLSDLTIGEFKWFSTGRAGEMTSFSVPFNNYSEDTLRFSVYGSEPTDMVFPKKYSIPPKSLDTLRFKVRVNPGEHYHTLNLKREIAQIEIMVRVFGYDLSTTELDAMESLQLDSTFIYYRKGNESLLRFYDVKKEEIVMNVPLSREITEINITDLKPGEYWLEKVHFDTKRSTFSKVHVK